MTLVKRVCGFILAFALLLGLAACGAAQPQPTTQATSTAPVTAAPSKAAFERALQLYRYFSMSSMQVDQNDTIERDGVTYYRVTDPEFPTMDALALALSEVFSFEIMRDFLHRTVHSTQPWNTALDPGLAQTLLYVTKEPVIGELYTCMGDRGSDITSYSVGAVSESDDKIVSKLSAMTIDGETKEYLLTQELFEGNWVFTDFPLDW